MLAITIGIHELMDKQVELVLRDSLASKGSFCRVGHPNETSTEI